MSSHDTHRYLAAMGRCAMFSSLDERRRLEILACGQIVTRRKGESIVTPTQPAEALYIVLAGRVKVYKLSARGDERILHLIGPSETFGEAAVLAGGRYPAFASATEASVLLALRRQALSRLLGGSAELALGMLAGMAAKLHEFAATIERLSLQDVPGRLAAALLAQAAAAGSDAFDLPLTKRELASRLGTTAETLSRTLARFKAAGTIEVRGPRITLRKPDRLEAIAAGSPTI